jgi:hypothetical protein
MLKNKASSFFLLVTISLGWYGHNHADNLFGLDLSEQAWKTVYDFTNGPLANVLAGIAKNAGQDVKISLADIPLEVTISDKVFHQIYSLFKPFLGLGFALLGGLIIKNGCEGIGKKDPNTKAAKTQIIIGIIMTLTGFTYMCLQSPK